MSPAIGGLTSREVGEADSPDVILAEWLRVHAH